MAWLHPTKKIVYEIVRPLPHRSTPDNSALPRTGTQPAPLACRRLTCYTMT
jgi:hypothetical protein